MCQFDFMFKEVLNRFTNVVGWNPPRPELHAMPNLVDNTVDPHNAFAVCVPFRSS